MRWFVCAVALGLLVSPVAAADLASLGWGSFTQEGDGPVKVNVLSAEAGHKELKLSMAIDDMTVKAEGRTAEDSRAFTGNFVVEQPGTILLPQLTITIKGTIVKTGGSTAALDVTVGPVRKTLNWTNEQAAAEPFAVTFVETLADGQMPVPFPVAATAAANRLSETGAVALTLKSIDVTAGQTQVALGSK